MIKTAKELAAGATNDLEKVQAVFYYVSKNIRYMGLTPEKDRPGFEPHDVKITFDKKYGVCRDKAALLVAMLRAAGLQAYPVLISVGVKRDPQVPDPDFNHAIVSVELKKGEYLLMDPTDEHARDLLPEWDCDQSYLVCRPEGEDLKTSPVPPPDEHLMRIKTTGVLSATGALEAKSELAFEGVNDDAYRNAFSHMKPDDKQRFFERNLKESLPGARLKSLKLTPEDMMDVSVPVHAELEFSVDGMTAVGNGKAVVSLPWIGRNLGVVNFILGGAGLDKRKYPMTTEVTCGLEEDVSIKLARRLRRRGLHAFVSPGGRRLRELPGKLRFHQRRAQLFARSEIESGGVLARPILDAQTDVEVPGIRRAEGPGAGHFGNRHGQCRGKRGYRE